MKTLFIVPPFPARTYPGKTMGPDYLAGALVNQAGTNPQDVEILDLDVLGSEALEGKLRNKDYDLVGVSFLSFQSDEAMKIAEKTDAILKSRGRRNTQDKKYAPIIVGGHGTSQCDQIVSLFPKVDAWAIGEGLETILDVVKSTQKGSFLKERAKIAGLKYLEGQKVITTSRRDLVERLDDFVPLRLNHYSEYNFEVLDNQKTAQVMSQVGCAGACVFCHESTARGKVRQRSIESIKQEIEGLILQEYKAIYFDDSTFTFDRKRTLQITELMKQFNQSAGVVWGFNTRVDCLDKNLIDKIKKSGCNYMFAGVESLVPEALAGMNKIRGSSPDYGIIRNGQNYVRKAKQTFKWMSEIGQTKSCFLIFGGPTLSYEVADGKRKTVRGVETFEQAKKTIKQAVWELDPEYISINIMRFIPDALMSSSPAFAGLRGSKENIHAGHFSRKWKEEHNIYNEEGRQHPIFMAYEAAGQDYPIPPHMTPQYCYSILEELVKEINRKNEKIGKHTTIMVDKTFKKYLPQDEYGVYHLAKFEEMTPEVSVYKPRILRNRVESFVKPALALAASVILAVGGSLYLHDKNIKGREFRGWEQAYIMKMVKDYPLNNGLLVKYVGGDTTIERLTTSQVERVMSLICTDDPKDLRSILVNPAANKDYKNYRRFVKLNS